jgi:preprotein translocase subunit SecB
MPVQISPLQLEGYYVRELHFVTRTLPGGDPPLALQMGLHPQLSGLFDPGDLTVNLRAGGIPNLEEPNRLMAVLEIQSQTAPEIKLPYDFRAVLVGYFRLHPEMSIEDRERAMEALKTTAASVLYSIARELIAAVTSRGPYPAIVLPTVVITMDEMWEQEQPTAAKKGGRKSAAKKAAGKKGKKSGKKA